MHIEELRNSCLSVKGCTESLPFLDKNILVFKVMDKMFAYVSLAPKDGVFRVNLKCDPDQSVQLREQYKGIDETDFKSYLWNSVNLESDVPDQLIRELVDHSANEVIKKLSKKKREEYHQQANR